MATFKVGQRVKIIGPLPLGQKHFEDVETSITGGPFVSFDGEEAWHTAYSDADHKRGVLAANLAPLTDPKADEFIERIKKLEREPISIAPKVPA